jgi:hypothetical protein
MTSSIAWLQSLVEGKYKAFPAEDQEFIKAYWEIVFHVLLNYHQRDLEGELNISLHDATGTTKRFYQGVGFDYSWQTYAITSLPFRIPAGTSEYKVYGPKAKVEETVDLPVDLGDGAEIISYAGGNNTRLDGTKVLGSGEANLTYYTTRISNPEVENGYLTEATATSISCYRLSSDRLTYEGIGEVLSNGYLYDTNSDFSSLPLGCTFTVNAVDLKLVKVHDQHTVELSILLPIPGRVVRYTHDGFGFVVDTDAVSIPWFTLSNGSRLVEGRDFIIQDGQIGFCAYPGDALIADRVYYDNDQIFELFGKYIGLPIVDGEHPDRYHERVMAKWYGIFHGSNRASLEFCLHVFMGLPFVSYAMDDVVVKGFDYTWERGEDWVTITPDDFKIGKVTTDVAYFTPDDQYIMWEDGAFSKIVHMEDSQTVWIDGYVPDAAEKGQVGAAKISRMYVTDKYGVEHWYDIPNSCAPTGKIGQTLEKWSKCCSGVRVYDACDRGVTLNGVYLYPPYVVWNHEDFLTAGSSSSKNLERMLRAGTFTVETDVQMLSDVSVLDSLKAGETEYSKHDRSEIIGIWDSTLVTI